MKYALLFALVGVALAQHTIPVQRLPSHMEIAIARGTWQQEWAEYVKQRDDARLKAESEPQTDFYNTFYLGKINIGTPMQNFTMVLDTGSSDLWVTDKTWSGSGKHRFDSSKSSTYKKVSGTWVIHYGSGSASGFKGMDMVCFDQTDYCFKTQIFGQATKMGVQARQPIDGICGMAYQTISAIRTPDPWLNIINDPGFKDQPYFEVWLEELNGSPMGAKGGAFTFGGMDTKHCSSQCDWVPISHQLWYEIEIDGVGSGSYMSGSGSAISDTGTSFMIGPPRAIEEIAKKVGGQFNSHMGLFGIDCDTTNNNNTIDVKIMGKTYPISAKNYVVTFDNGGTCWIAAVGAHIGNPQWILGDTFIRQFCNIYDMKNNKLGLCAATM